MTKYCTECGKKLEYKNKFCPFCGAKSNNIEKDINIESENTKGTIPSKFNKKKSKKPWSKKEKIALTFLIIVIMIVIAVPIISAHNDQEEASQQLYLMEEYGVNDVDDAEIINDMYEYGSLTIDGETHPNPEGAKIRAESDADSSYIIMNSSYGDDSAIMKAINQLNATRYEYINGDISQEEFTYQVNEILNDTPNLTDYYNDYYYEKANQWTLY